MRKVILSQVTPFNTFFLHLSKSLYTSDGQLISLITRVLPLGHAVQAIGMSEQCVDVARQVCGISALPCFDNMASVSHYPNAILITNLVDRLRVL